MAKHLESLYVKNFRCLDELTIDRLGDVNLLVGGNNSGKTTVLEALEVFALKGLKAVLRYIASSHDEYNREVADELDENDCVDIVEVLFNGRKFSDDENEFIAIGEHAESNNLLKIADTYYYTTHSTKSHDDGDEISIKKNIVRKNELDSHKERSLKKAIRISYKQDAAFLPKSISGFMNCNFIPSNTFLNFGLAEQLGGIAKDGELSKVIKILQIIHKDIEDIRTRTITIESKNNLLSDRISGFSPQSQTKTIIDVKVTSDPRYFPLKSMGEGVSRILQIALHAYDAKDGILLIDELENGLHYSIQEKVWEWLFELAKQYNMQIFATTHSKDVIENFNNVAQAREEEGILISLGRSRSGKLVSNPYSEEDLDVYVTTGMEVRG